MLKNGCATVVYIVDGLVPGYGVRCCSYDVWNHDLTMFLGAFDVWGRCGILYGDETERWFEFSPEMMEFVKTDAFRMAVEKYAVKVVYEYPFDIHGELKEGVYEDCFRCR